MRKVISLLVICCCVQAACGQTSDKRFAGLDTLFNRVLKDWKAVGFSVAVVQKNKVVYTKGAGLRDLEKKLPVTPNTLFAIGSCTKAFTSSLIGLLEKDGKIDYDKPVRDYLPSLKFFNDAMNSEITVRDMMCHRTGLPRHDYAWYAFPTTRDSLMYRVRFLEPTAPVRQAWQYNNFMFTAQGVLAEKLYGKSYEQLIKEKLFDSLGMTSSNLSINEMMKNPDASIGYGVEKDSLIKKLDYKNIDAMAPAGGINSNANEMANWLITWINGGKFNGKEVLPASYVTEASTSQMVSGSGVPDKENPDIHLSTYGFAWSISSYRGHYRVQHGGNIDGFSTITCFFPSDSIGIVVLVNQNGSGVPPIVRNIIADRVLNLSRKDWNGDQKKADRKAKADAKNTEKNKTAPAVINAPMTHSLKDYEGTYTSPGYGSLDVSVKNDSLFADLPGSTLWLKHFRYDIFQLYDVDKTEGIDTTAGGSNIQFGMSNSGEIDAIHWDLQPGVSAISFKRTPKAATVKAEVLKKYAGDYELSGITARVYLKNGNVLYVFVPGQPEYETIPAGNDEFKLKILSGYSVKFEVNDKGVVTAINFVQPNGTFKAKRK